MAHSRYSINCYTVLNVAAVHIKPWELIMNANTKVLLRMSSWEIEQNKDELLGIYFANLLLPPPSRLPPLVLAPSLVLEFIAFLLLPH